MNGKKPTQKELKKQLNKEIKNEISIGLVKSKEVLDKLKINMEVDFFFQYFQHYQDVYKSLAVLQHYKICPPKLCHLWLQKWFKNLHKENYNEWDKIRRKEWIKFKKSLNL